MFSESASNYQVKPVFHSGSNGYRTNPDDARDITYSIYKVDTVRNIYTVQDKYSIYKTLHNAVLYLGKYVYLISKTKCLP